MAFSAPSPSVSICDSSGLPLFDLLVTSICTTETPSGEQWMFGISHPNIAQTFRYNRANGYAAWQDYNNANSSIQTPSNTNGVERDLGYIVATASSSFDFTLYPAGTNGTPTPLIANSGVPGQRTATATEYIAFASYQSSGPPTGSLGAQWADVVTTSYKDPAVLYLSSIQKWIAVLCRVRVLSSGTPTPTNSISDIIAYVADDPSFTTNRVGPYWLVSSLNAMPPRGAPRIYDRLWLGVPAAFEVSGAANGGGLLFLYYTVDSCDLTSTISSFGQPADTGTYPGFFGTPYSTSPAQGVPGIGVSIIDTFHFLAPPIGGFTSDADWENPTAWPSALGTLATLADLATIEVPKVLAGRVRLWCAVYGSLTQDVVALDALLTDKRAVDPAAITNQAGNDKTIPASQITDPASASVSLFFATSPRAPSVSSVGHGVWRSTACTDGLGLQVYDFNGTYVAPFAATFGVDWLVRNASFDGGLSVFTVNAQDVVAASAEPLRYIDPSPQLLSTGVYRLHMGHLDSSSPRYPTTLVYIETSTLSDLFIPADQCWS